MAITAKPTSYTVNTSHTKCPTHLWMLDEGSTLASADKGSGTALNLTLVNAAQWSSDALGVVMISSSADSYHAYSATGTVWGGSTGGLLLVSIFKSDSAVGSAAAENILSCCNSSTATTICSIRNNGTVDVETGIASATADDASGVSRVGGTVYDQNWHMIACKFRVGTSTDCCAISVDGGAWDLDPADTLGTLTLDRYGVGVRAGQFLVSEANGEHLAAMAYESSSASAYTDWNDSWIAALYSDPWQFLNTSALTDQQVQFYRRPNTLLRM